MPGGKTGGGSEPPPSGGTIATQAPGTFTATASTTGISTFDLPDKGFLTELSIRVDGDIASATPITGGPVKIEAWLKRGTQMARQLCSGAIQNELSIRGSGQLPVQQGNQIVVKWTELSGTGVIVRVDAFVDTVSAGDSAPGWEDETPSVSYIYQARRVNTQTNAGGGALRTRISIAPGQLARLISLYVVGSASAASALQVYSLDEDAANDCLIANIAAGVSRIASLPSIGSPATGMENTGDSGQLVLGSGQFLSATSLVAILNETLTIGIVLELFNSPTIPTWDTTGSAGTPSLAASTISGANTITLGRLWN